MEKKIFEGKNKEDVINKCLNELNEKEDNLIIKLIEKNNKLLKKTVKIEVIKYNDLIDYVRTEIKNILELIGLDVNLEIIRKENDLFVNLDTNNNSMLIGKNGKNLKALQDIVRHIINEETNNKVNIIMDINNYKQNREKSIIRLAKTLAKEVANTKNDVKMLSMNSYERRIVHNALTNNMYVYTESIGEEPNRCVVIKPKE